MKEYQEVEKRMQEVREMYNLKPYEGTPEEFCKNQLEKYWDSRPELRIPLVTVFRFAKFENGHVFVNLFMLSHYIAKQTESQLKFKEAIINSENEKPFVVVPQKY